MPTGPKGERRLADVNVCAVMFAKIATGEITDRLLADDGKEQAAKVLGRKGGAVRAAKMMPERQALHAVRQSGRPG